MYIEGIPHDGRHNGKDYKMTQNQEIKAKIYKTVLNSLSAKGHRSDSILVQIYTARLASVEATQDKAAA